MMNRHPMWIVAAALMIAAMTGVSPAQSIFSEDFTGATTTNSWYFRNGACLTAGSSASAAQPGPVLSCGADWAPYYSTQQAGKISSGNVAADASQVGGANGTANGGTTTGAIDSVGNGALRFTNGYPYGYYEAGSIVSGSTFDASQGVQITFKTVTYRGNSRGAGGDGADGIGFQLMDGSLSPTDATFNGIGSVGGSLGYTCSNTNPPYDGLVGAYLGLGIDEYGNFLNGANYYPGYTGSNAISGAHGDNTALGYGYLPNRIGLRGTGNVSWRYLNAKYLRYYPSGLASTTNSNTNQPLSQTAVQNTCINGQVLDYSSTTANYSSCPVGGIQNLASTNANFTAIVSAGSNTLNVSTLRSGTIAIGQFVTGLGIVPGTYITATATAAGSSTPNAVVMSANAILSSILLPTTITTSPNTNCPLVVANAALTAQSPALPALYDYAPIQNAYMELPSSGANAVQIANEAAVARPTGITPPSSNGNVFLYNLKITQNGLLSLSYSINGGANTSVITNQSISATNGPLPSLLRFGFAGSTGGGTNIHELLCFKAAPVDASSSSSTTDQQQTGKLETTSQAYFAYYNPQDWTGRMTAYLLVTNTTTGALNIAPTATWDSQCVLSGVSNLPLTGTLTSPICPTTGLTTPSAAQPVTPGSSNSRVMMTWNNAASGSGVAFEWPGTASTNTTITSAEAGVLDLGDASATANRLNFLRGDRTKEIQSNGTGTYRTRDGVLSDIIDSSPTFVGAPNAPYSLAFKDRYVPLDATPENSGQSYSSFIASNQSRLNAVYVGANDGFVHGFRSGTEDAAGNIAQNFNDGQEILAYMPGAVVNTIHNALLGALDFANPQYSHNFYVDATPGSGDLYYNGAWHTWLVGGLGVGGADIYALDVTDSSTNALNENNAANVVIGDWTPSTITCANLSTCGLSMGNTYGTPLVRRLHNGMWGVIFGNGFGSTTGDAGIFVMTVDQTSGAKTFYYLSTATGTAATPNGIAYVTAADLDGDHITDYVYAGDLQGHVWRFDLTACSPVATSSTNCTVAAGTGWGVSTTATTVGSITTYARGPLFTTQTGQPITTPVVLASAVVVGANPVLIVSFGTGLRTPLTATSGSTYQSSTQSLYGVWDWNFSTWNANSGAQYASLTTAQMAAVSGAHLSSPYTLTYSNLQRQTFSTGTNTGSVESSNATITWDQCSSGATPTCNGGSFGWYANLPGSNGSGSFEQIISNPSLFQQGLIVNSTIPAVNNPLSCTTRTDTGNTYIISVISGGTFTSTTTTTPQKVSGFLTNSDANTVGENTNETGALTVVNNGSGTFLIGQSNNPSPGSPPGQATPFALPTNIQANRITWSQLR